MKFTLRKIACIVVRACQGTRPNLHERRLGGVCAALPTWNQARKFNENLCRACDRFCQVSGGPITNFLAQWLIISL
ncbi:MAG: hypothetical protein ACP5I8_10400, partial [Phycisphaerae bacterium]